MLIKFYFRMKNSFCAFGLVYFFVIMAIIMGQSVSRVSLDEKVRVLQESLMKRPTMNLNIDRWNTYVKSSPRNYSMIVMFTVLSQRMNCPICK